MARSLGTLTVDLVLKLGGFEQGADAAQRQAQRLEQSMRGIKKEGERLAASLATPFEKFEKSVAAVDALLKKEVITQETYNRAVAQLTDELNAADPAQQKLNQQLAEGAKVAQAVATPVERYEATVANLDALLKANAIGQETYNRALAQARQTLDATDADLQQHNKLLAEGKALTQSLLTPQERLTQELAQYDKLLKASAIDQRTFNRAVSDAQTRFKQAGGGGLGGFATSLSKVNNLLLGFGVGFSALAIVNEFKQAASAAIEFGDEIEKAMIKTGASAEALTGLAYAAKQTDVPLDALLTSLKRMQILLAEAARAGEKGNEATQALAELGLTIKDLQGLSADEQFKLIADQISRLGDEAARTSLLVKIFGKAGDQLAPLFEHGAAGIEAFLDQAERTHNVFGPAQVGQLSDADDAIKQLIASYDGLTRSLAILSASRIADFFDSVASGVNSLTSALTDLLPKITATLEKLGGFGQVLELGFKIAGRVTHPIDAIADAWNGVTAAENRAAAAADAAVKHMAAVSRGGGSAVLARASDLPAPPGPTPASGGASSARQRAREDVAPFLKEITVSVRQITTTATEQLYKQMDEATQTSMERQLAEWEDFDSQVRELVSAGRISEEEGARRSAEHVDEILQPIEVHAERIPEKFAEAGDEAGKVFSQHLKENTQDIIADFLTDPFEEGINGMLQSFDKMLQQMAAQAIAAKIAEKLFGGADNWLEGLIKKIGGLGGGSGFFGAIGSFFGFAEGGTVKGPGTGTSDSVPAMLSAGEFVVKAEAVRKPGVQRLLEHLNDGVVFRNPAPYDIPRFAAGGMVMPTVSAAVNTLAPMTTTTQQGNTRQYTVNVPISAPTGTVSRSTELQVSAAVARGIRMADLRGN